MMGRTPLKLGNTFVEQPLGMGEIGKTGSEHNIDADPS